MQCLRCGACCVAPDISSLSKPVGVRCRHLTEEFLCGAYETRPAVCRGYRPDALCRDIASPTLDERVEKYLAVFGIPCERQGGEGS